MDSQNTHYIPLGNLCQGWIDGTVNNGEYFHQNVVYIYSRGSGIVWQRLVPSDESSSDESLSDESPSDESPVDILCV